MTARSVGRHSAHREYSMQLRSVHTPSRVNGALTVALAIVACAALYSQAAAEVRTFAVMLANSPKSFANSNGFPTGGLTSVESIDTAYFDSVDPNIDSLTTSPPTWRKGTAIAAFSAKAWMGYLDIDRPTISTSRPTATGLNFC